jgi:hypothetical protein
LLQDLLVVSSFPSLSTVFVVIQVFLGTGRRLSHQQSVYLTSQIFHSSVMKRQRSRSPSRFPLRPLPCLPRKHSRSPLRSQSRSSFHSRSWNDSPSPFDRSSSLGSQHSQRPQRPQRPHRIQRQQHQHQQRDSEKRKPNETHSTKSISTPSRDGAARGPTENGPASESLHRIAPTVEPGPHGYNHCSPKVSVIPFELPSWLTSSPCKHLSFYSNDSTSTSYH